MLRLCPWHQVRLDGLQSKIATIQSEMQLDHSGAVAGTPEKRAIHVLQPQGPDPSREQTCADNSHPNRRELSSKDDGSVPQAIWPLGSAVGPFLGYLPARQSILRNSDYRHLDRGPNI